MYISTKFIYTRSKHQNKETLFIDVYTNDPVQGSYTDQKILDGLVKGLTDGRI